MVVGKGKMTGKALPRQANANAHTSSKPAGYAPRVLTRPLARVRRSGPDAGLIWWQLAQGRHGLRMPSSLGFVSSWRAPVSLRGGPAADRAAFRALVSIGGPSAWDQVPVLGSGPGGWRGGS